MDFLVRARFLVSQATLSRKNGPSGNGVSVPAVPFAWRLGTDHLTCDLQGALAEPDAMVVDAGKKESERERKRKILLGEKKEVCSKRV